MTNQDHTSLDAETRDAFIGAFTGGSLVESVSDEDLAVVAERGLDSFSPEQRDRLLKAMISNTDGAAGTVDVYRLLHDKSSEDSNERHWLKRFDIVSGSMVGAWAMAACLALMLSVGAFSTPVVQSSSGIDWTTGGGLGISNQEGVSGPSMIDLLNNPNIKPIDSSSDSSSEESEVTSNDSKRLWLMGSVFIMILIPPALGFYRRKRQ